MKNSTTFKQFKDLDSYQIIKSGSDLNINYYSASISPINNGTNININGDLTVYNSLENGLDVIASGEYSHAEGYLTQAKGDASHAEGFWTVASGSYQHVQGQYNLSSSAQSAFIIGNGTADNLRSNLVFASGSTFQVTGSLNVSGSITGSLFGTSSFASTASFAPNYLPLTGGTINVNVTVNGTASIAFLNVTYESASVIYSSGSNQFGDATNDTQTLIGTVIVSGSQQITGSLNVTQGITGSFTGSFIGDGSQLTGISQSLLRIIVSPDDVYYGTRLQPITTNSGFFTSSSLNNNTGYFVKNTNTSGNGAIAAFTAQGSGAPFTNATQLAFFGDNYFITKLRTNAALYSTNNLYIVAGKNTNSTIFTLGNTGTPSLSSTDDVLILSSSREITAPSLTTTIINNESTGKSLITKEWYNSRLATNQSYSGSFTGSFTGVVTGSLFGTSSWATNSVTSSFITGSNVFGPFGSNSIISASNSLSSSYATIAGNASSISASITNNVNNYVLTATGTGVINGEANLTFDGTTLNVEGSLQNGTSVNPVGIYSHTEGAKTVTLLDFSHAEGGGAFTGQYGYDVVNIGDNGELVLSSDYGNVASRFTGGFILYDDREYDSTYGFRRLQYTSASYDGTHTYIFLSDQTITTPSKRATVGIPGIPIPSGSKTVIPFNKDHSHAEGFLTIADGEASHAEGSGSTSIGDYSHAEGILTQAIGLGSHTEGSSTLAVGNYSHAEGLQTQTINPNSHTEGNSTYTGQYGYQAEYTGTPGVYGLFEKYGDVSAQFTNQYVIVDDTFQDNTVGLTEVKLEVVSFSGTTLITIDPPLTTPKLYIGVSGVFAPTYADKIIPVNKESSHAEGSGSFALGTGAHAEGYNTRAIGNYSNTKGLGTIAEGEGQVIIGKYNSPTASSDITFMVGGGSSENDRRNTMYVQGRDVFMTRDLTVTRTIIGSLFGTASYAVNAATASNVLGGSINHIPYFITDTTLATSSLYQSGSSTVIINQDNATTANPEALYVWQPHPTSFNVISGKGDINNYLQLNIQNTNQGDTASSDVVATADNGDETTNYIDMGINGENYAGVLGGPNDGYLYSTGVHLHIGNATPNQYVGFFAGGDDVDTNMKLVLDANDQHQMTGSLEISGSLNVKNNLTSSGLLTNGTNTVLGNTIMSGSSTIQGTTTMTGSLRITGSTTQVGNNTLLGNTVLSGSILISGSVAPGNLSASVNIYGDTAMSGFLRFNPYTTNIDTSISASYVYVSGSTNDLYFSQNGAGYSNTTRLRWLEGNLYTGLLNGGLISTQSSTVYQVSSGSGIVVNLNASLSDNPYPTVTYVNWPTISASIAPLSASYDQSFVSIQADGTLFTQGTPYNDGQFNTLIPIGNVIHQNRSTINATATYPSVAYGYKQRSSDFLRAFGALKLSGLNTIVSGSSTGSISITGGTAYAEGRNYVTDPNNPSYVIETGQPTSKIFRYYQSGSGWAYLTNGGAGYQTIDPTQYSDNGVLTAVPGTGINRRWTIQRVYYFPGGATKGIYVYYGNQTYASQIEAIANIPYETFVEAPNTAGGAVLSAYLIVRNNADFTVADSYNIQQGGLFRNVGGAGGGGSTATTRLIDLSDVSITSPTNHNLLAYNSSTTKWENVSTITANVTGTATTASYISPTFISASAAASGFGSGGGGSVDTGSLLTTASFNAYTSSNTSQFAGTASFATTAQNLLGSVQTAATASYATNFTIENTLTLDETLIDFAKVNSSIVGNNNLYQIATGSYTSAFTKYTVSNGANARAGEFITVWNGTNVVNYDNSTTDIGSTSDVTFTSAIVTSQIKIDTVTLTSGWRIKSTTTFI